MQEIKLKEISPDFKGMKIRYTCEVCKKSFESIYLLISECPNCKN